MRHVRISALERGRPFLTIDRDGIAHILQVQDPAWDGPGEGNKVLALPVQVLPLDLGLSIVPLGSLTGGDIFLLPALDGYRLYRVSTASQDGPGVRVGQLGPSRRLVRTVQMDASDLVYAQP